MYDAFMTGYASFGEQINARRAAAEKARQLSKQLYRLSIKLAKDIVEDELPSGSKERSAYVSSVRRQLKSVSEKNCCSRSLSKRPN